MGLGFIFCEESTSFARQTRVNTNCCLVPKWLIPFFHHPPFCAGPRHASRLDLATGNREGDYKTLSKPQLDDFIGAGARVVFCGHEHNFELAKPSGYELYCVISGAGGALRPAELSLDALQKASIQSWSNQCHFLMVSIKSPHRETMEIRVIGARANGTPTEDIPVWKTGEPRLRTEMPIKINL
ncbi:MAG: hypothetical protein HY774_14640 [Acidobacteria bacterium]|nr:hypothetical protein [Acidobacteriota bacterium]